MENVFHFEIFTVFFKLQLLRGVHVLVLLSLVTPLSAQVVGCVPCRAL